MTIPRISLEQLISRLQPNKVLLLLGARRVGKTFLLNQFIKSIDEKFIFWNGEDITVHDLVKRRTAQNYINLIGSTRLLIIDEAQKIPGIGMILKLMIDTIDGLKIIATGSSAFDLSGQAGEPLVGRKYDINLYPLSEQEFSAFEGIIPRFDNIRHRMVFGNMPELVNINDSDQKKEYLKNLVGSYLMRDILSYENIRNSGKILDLLKLIAYQIGNEVSLEELGRQLNISKNTVEKYLDLLSKVFIIHKLTGFSRNLRKEIKKHSKWYFFDNGIRNAIINNFNSLEHRDDIGVLWENYMVSERIKFQSYNRLYSNNYFWRTYDQQEIDWVEEREGSLFAYEFKWKDQKVKIPKAWTKAYPSSEFKVISQENYFEWIVKES